MEVRIRHGKDTQAEAFARFHRVVSDEPFDEGGGDTGMTPAELMLSALGCCAMQHATDYLRVRKLALAGVGLRISAIEEGEPPRLIEIGIEVDAAGLEIRAREGLIKSIEACLLHRTFANPPKLKVGMARLVVEGQNGNSRPPARLTLRSAGATLK